MNPDGDKNQNTPDNVPNADPTQQAIFTPAQTPAPEPPRPEQNPSVVVGSVVEPASAPTGLSHQYYSNHPAKTSASGVGDIIIDNNKLQKKNKKKIWIVGGIFLGVMILVGVIIAILSQKPTASNSHIQTAFNKFANTLLYNDENNVSNIPNSYEYGNQYFLDTINNENDIKVYFDRVEVKYEEFINLYKEYAENHTDNELTQDNLQYFLTYYENLDLFSYIELRPIIGPTDFMDIFLDNPDLVSTRMEEYFAIFADSKVESTRNYAGEYKKMLEQLLIAFNTYQSLGCLGNRSVFIGCIENSTNPQLATPNATYNSFQDFYRQQVALFKDLSINVYQNIWFIDEELEVL